MTASDIRSLMSLFSFGHWAQDDLGRRSTHTFILYLSDCLGGGGETVLLDHMEDRAEAVLASVEPGTPLETTMATTFPFMKG